MTAHERTGWRDQQISERHRIWGFNCPAVDLDFLMVEYNLGAPVALVEYKDRRARKPDLNHATYRAINQLANIAELPFLIAFYWPECWAFRVSPVNARAKLVYRGDILLTERRFVKSLYHLRGLKIEEQVYRQLNTSLPSEAEVA